MSEQLKPCPFCGKFPQVKSVLLPFDTGKGRKIAQCECGAFLYVGRWNTRSAEDALLSRAEKAEGELDEFIKIHPRAVKLLRKKKNFLVVAEDEPYFFKVYVLLRAHEKEIGRWTDEDENNYQIARQAYYGRHIDLPEVKE